jgi:hypothetical protein
MFTVNNFVRGIFVTEDTVHAGDINVFQKFS